MEFNHNTFDLYPLFFSDQYILITFPCPKKSIFNILWYLFNGYIKQYLYQHHHHWILDSFWCVNVVCNTRIISFDLAVSLLGNNENIVHFLKMVWTVALWNCCSECTPTDSYLSFPAHLTNGYDHSFPSYAGLETGHGEVLFGVYMTFIVSGGWFFSITASWSLNIPLLGSDPTPAS